MMREHFFLRNYMIVHMLIYLPANVATVLVAITGIFETIAASTQLTEKKSQITRSIFSDLNNDLYSINSTKSN